MGFHSTRNDSYEGIGFAAAFEAKQVADHLCSTYDVVDVYENLTDVETFHHSQSVYRIEIKVAKVSE